MKTAKEIIYTLPGRLIQDKIDDTTKGLFHIDLEGDDGGQFTVSLKNRSVEVEDGLIGEPSCLIQTSAKTFVDIELGNTNPQMAFMMGKIKISNLGEMLKFLNVFSKLEA